MKLYNSLSHSIEEFDPINPPHVGMYTCGPTVYDFMHIGNLRTFVLSDTLYRALVLNRYQVKAVENITDIDDKIIKRAKERNVSITELAQEFTRYFLKDLDALNVSMDNIISTKATEYIPQMIKYIQVLIEKNLAYEKDGSVYFDVSAFKDYGKLSGVENRELKTGTRILSDEYTKDNVQDFALWKKSDDEVGYESPWGLGRPGWHIECSVMSQENLGDTFDLHVGGIDLLFPHHENEIAQSEGKTGKPFVNYFVHGAHMLVDGKKMSKSLDNFYTLSDVKKQKIDPLALRYLYFQTHYRQEMNFTWESLHGAQAGLDKLYRLAEVFGKHPNFTINKQPSNQIMRMYDKFVETINNDLDMPGVLGFLHQGLKVAGDDFDTMFLLESIDEVLGLKFKERGIQSHNDQIGISQNQKLMELIGERETLRKQKRFHLADEVRHKINKLGYDIEDTEGKPHIKKLR